MPFELPPWLQETSKPFQTFAQGATIGLAIGRSYAQARQFQQSMDLQQKQLARADASHSLAYMINATKFIQDQQDYKALEQFTPTVSTAMTFDELSKFKVPMLHDTKNYLSLSALLDRRKTEKAMGEMAGELANTTDWADPAVRGIMLKWAQKAPDITLEPAYDHLIGRHQAAIKAKLEETVFTPRQYTTPGGTEMVQIGAHSWQVVDKKPPTGKMTDPEKQQILDLRADIDRLADDLVGMGGPPKGGLFGGETKQQKEYNAKAASLDALRAKRDDLYKSIQARDVDSDPNAIREAYKAGKITKEEAVEQLRKLGFQ